MNGLYEIADALLAHWLLHCHFTHHATLTIQLPKAKPLVLAFAGYDLFALSEAAKAAREGEGDE